jgi:hypothetical protein
MSESPETTPLSDQPDYPDYHHYRPDCGSCVAARATVPAGPEPCKACIALGDLCGKHQREPNEAARIPAGPEWDGTVPGQGDLAGVRLVVSDRRARTARPVPAAGRPRHAHPSVHPSLCPACQAVPAADSLAGIDPDENGNGIVSRLMAVPAADEDRERTEEAVRLALLYVFQAKTMNARAASAVIRALGQDGYIVVRAGVSPSTGDAE